MIILAYMSSIIILGNQISVSVCVYQNDIWHKIKLNVGGQKHLQIYLKLKVFGYVCYPNLRSSTPHKLAPRTKECIFLGYPTSTKG